MSNGDEQTVTLTTDELTRLIRQEMDKAIANMITRDQLEDELKSYMRNVNEVIDAKIDTAIDRTFTPYLEEIRKIPSELGSIKETLARLLEQTKNTSETVKDVKEEQDEINKKIDETQGRMTRLETHGIEQAAKLESQEHAIFGDKSRPGTKSLFDHMTDIKDTISLQLGDLMNQIAVEREQAHQEMAQLQQTSEEIKADVEANKQFRERRQRIEAVVLQALPKAGKRLWEAATNDWVIKWATRIGLGGALAVLAALLERLQ